MKQYFPKSKKQRGGEEWGDPNQVPFDFSPYDQPKGNPYKPQLHGTPWEQNWIPNTANPGFYQIKNPQDVNPGMWSKGSRLEGPNNERYGLFNNTVPNNSKSKINQFDMTIHNPVTQQSPFNIPSKNAQVGDISYPNYVQRPDQMTPNITPLAYTPGMYDKANQRVPEGNTDVTQNVKVGRKNWKDRWWADPDVINAGMEGVTNVANYFDRQKKEKWLRQQTSWDKLNPYGERPDRGKYTPNGGIFDPYNMTPVEQPGNAGFMKYGGMYNGGGELYMDEDEIKQILAEGGSVEYLDE
jgi:hypothetical protein